jgi:hypothetical protein
MVVFKIWHIETTGKHASLYLICNARLMYCQGLRRISASQFPVNTFSGYNYCNAFWKIFKKSPKPLDSPSLLMQI